MEQKTKTTQTFKHILKVSPKKTGTSTGTPVVKACVPTQ